MFRRSLRRVIFSLSGLAAGLIIAAPQLAGAAYAIPPSYAPAPVAQTSAVAQFTRPYKVAIQIGHYKNDELPDQLSRLVGSTGTYGGGRSEVNLNLDVSNRIAKLLRGMGVTVELLPATVPTGYSADAFIAIHADGNNSSSAHGFKISTRWRSVVSLQDALLVEKLTTAYQAATNLPEDSNVTRNMRGYYAYSPWRANYRTSNFTPGAIVETGYMTSPADRAVLFNATDKVAAGVVNGIMDFLKAAYPRTAAAPSYGLGIVDKDINPLATPAPNPRPGSGPQITRGNWQVVLMGKPLVNVYSERGGGSVIAQLPRGKFFHSTVRRGDYYNIVLPDGREGWVHRNAIVVQM